MHIFALVVEPAFFDSFKRCACGLNPPPSWEREKGRGRFSRLRLWDQISSTVYIPLIVDIPQTGTHRLLASLKTSTKERIHCTQSGTWDRRLLTSASCSPSSEETSIEGRISSLNSRALSVCDSSQDSLCFWKCLKIPEKCVCLSVSLSVCLLLCCILQTGDAPGRVAFSQVRRRQTPQTWICEADGECE